MNFDKITKYLTLLALILAPFGWFYTRGGGEAVQLYTVTQHTTDIKDVQSDVKSIHDRVTKLEGQFSATDNKLSQQTLQIKSLEMQLIEQMRMLERVNTNTDMLLKIAREK